MNTEGNRSAAKASRLQQRHAVRRPEISNALSKTAAFLAAELGKQGHYRSLL